MKRVRLIRMIARAARQSGAEWVRLRDNGDHEVWSFDGVRIVVPRHRELNEVTALGILLSLEGRLGARWWRR